MKIALLLSGLTRSTSLCYSSVDRFLLSKYDVDVYIHTWDVSNVSLDGQKFENEIEIEKLISLYNPKKIVVEDYFSKRDWLNEKYEKYKKIEGTYDRTISMFYKIEKCFNLVDKEENKYDFLIRSRMDVLMNEEIDFTKLDKFSINIPNHQVNKQTIIKDDLAYSVPIDSFGIIDSFSIGNYENMRKYSNIFSNLDKLCLDMSLDYHPEFLTLKNLEIYNTSINRFDFDFLLVRKINK